MGTQKKECGPQNLLKVIVTPSRSGPRGLRPAGAGGESAWEAGAARVASVAPSATEEEIMAMIQSDPRTVPSARDERIIRRIMRLTLYTLVAMVLALVSLTVFGA